MKKSSFLKKAFNYSIFFFASACLATVALVGNTNKVNVAKADTITDLTGCTWVGNDAPSADGYSKTYTYNINFTSNSVVYSKLELKTNHVPQTSVYYDSTMVYGSINWNMKWADSAYKTIMFDATDAGTAKNNADLIAWLNTNGTLTAPVGPAVSVTGVDLNYSEYSLSLSGSVQLTATVSPDNATNKDVTWSTSDSSVATVSSEGLVSAVAEGNATITVTTDDGSFTDTCSITVTNSGGDDPVDENFGLMTKISIVTNTWGSNFYSRTLWLDNFSYADGYNQDRRNEFVSNYYQNYVENWSNVSTTKSYHYWNTGVNLCAGGDTYPYVFYLPAWITNCTIYVEGNNVWSSGQHSINMGNLNSISNSNSGVGKTVNFSIAGNESGSAAIVDETSYSDQITINRYFLKSDGSVKAPDQVTCYKYYFGNVSKVAVDGYATNNKWYVGTTYAASDEYSTSNILTSTETINLVSKYEVGSNDSALEIRFTRQNWDGATYIHTWNEGSSGTTWPGYLMTWLWNNEYSQAVFSWSPSFDEPLYGNIIFNSNDNTKQTSTLTAPSTSKWYYNDGWHDVPTMDIYLYDYDNVYNGNVDLSLSRFGTSFADQFKATQMIDIATNGLIYKATINNRYDRVIFSNNGQDATDYLTTTGNYCYVKANDIEGKNTWWDNINYVFAHNFSQHTMLMDGTVPTDDHSSTQYCSSRYSEAKTHFNAIMNSGYGTYVLTQLNNNFSAAMDRFASWARANGESINASNGVISSLKWINITSISNNSGMIVIIVLSIFAIGIASAYLVYRKKN